MVTSVTICQLSYKTVTQCLPRLNKLAHLIDPRWKINIALVKCTICKSTADQPWAFIPTAKTVQMGPKRPEGPSQRDEFQHRNADKPKHRKSCHQQVQATRRQSRYSFTVTQLEVMQRAFNANKYPKSSEISMMAERFQIPKKKIAVFDSCTISSEIQIR